MSGPASGRSATGLEAGRTQRSLRLWRHGATNIEDAAPSRIDAWQKGQKIAKEIVDRHPGPEVPPPVQIGQRPDEALGDEG